MILTNKMKPIALGALIASCVTLGLPEQSKAAVLVVDDFTNTGSPNASFCDNVFSFNQCVYLNSNSPVNTNTQSISGVTGGFRQLDITGTTNTNAQLGVSPTLQDLAWSNATGVSSTAKVTYDANNISPFLNLDASTYNQFQILVKSADLNLNITLELTSGLSGGPSVTRSLTLNGVGGGTGVEKTVIFDLSNVSFAGLNLSDIDRIAFTLTGPSDVDAQIDSVRFTSPPESIEIPESSFLLSVISVMVLGVASRKKKYSKV